MLCLAEGHIAVYPAPQGAPLRTDYSVEVCEDGSNNWTAVPTLESKANAYVGDGRHRVVSYSYAYFDFDRPVRLRVTRHCGTFATARVRPASAGIVPEVLNDSTVTLTLSEPRKVSLEFDGSVTDNLLLLCNALPPDRKEARKLAKANGQTFHSLGAGFHRLDSVMRVPGNTLLYLEPGAYLDGRLMVDDARNVTVTGRGVVRPSSSRDGMEGICVARSHGVTIDGIITTQCPVGGSDSVDIRNVTVMSHYAWGDGLNVFASSHVSYDGVFCRTSDDCTTAYATRKGFTGSCTHVLMRNSVLWADVAHPIFIGLHGNSERPDSLTDLTYRNIDILGQGEPQMDYQGCMAINAGDNNLVRRVLFEDIRVEDIERGSLVQVRVCWNPKYCTAPGRGIEDVTFRRVTYTGREPEPSLIIGYDAERGVHGVRFEGLTVNGRLIHDGMEGKPGWYKTTDMCRFFTGEHVTGLSFSQ